MSSEIPRHWRLKQQRYSLVGERLNGEYFFPPRAFHPSLKEAKVSTIKNDKAIDTPEIITGLLEVKTF